MDAFTPWPALVQRLRFLTSVTQSQLAQIMGVEQATVSRWERSVTKPDLWARRQIPDMLHKLEPAINPAAVEAMPVLAIM